MTEKQLREYVVSTAQSWLGYNEKAGTHKKIIDLYNSYKPLARGYKVKYTDAWCSTFASAVAIKAGLTDIIPTECGCENHIQLFKKIGRWQERDDYTPATGDYIFYDWDDSGVGDNKGYSDHIGIVVSVSGSVIKVIEGNINNQVGYREIKVNAKGIRGYGIPNYASKATVESVPAETVPVSTGFKKGDTVLFTGSLHYTSAYSRGIARGCKAGLAKITALAEGKAHPYHLQAVAGKGSTVYGWVNAKDISKIHIVKRGDTLGAIAKLYNTTVNKLVALNGIQNKNIISIGQIIKLN
jgi:hypothetical protein